MCKWRLKYEFQNEILVKVWTVKSLVKYPCISPILHQCKEQLFGFLSMLFDLLLMLYTSQDPAKYNMSTWIPAEENVRKHFIGWWGFPT